MAAAFHASPQGFQVRRTAVPELASRDVLVRVRFCGICGSDLHIYTGNRPVPPDICPGHEMSGEVVAVSEDVREVALGDGVCIDTLVTCRTCRYCLSGQHWLCSQLRVVGMHMLGGMAEYVRVPAYSVVRLPDGLAYDVAALAQPLSLSVHGLHIAGLTAGERVLILGSGGIGLLAAFAARALGAGEVLATYRYPHQGEAMRRIGAQRIWSADSEGMAALAEACRHEPVDIVVETVGGRADTFDRAVELVRPGGRVLVIGSFTEKLVLDPAALLFKGLHVIGTRGRCRPGLRSDLELSAHMLATHQQDVSHIITHRVPLAAVNEAFAIAANKSTGSLKVLVQPWPDQS
ncbi:MAG: zinc-binding dehydrogenase [Dehalococcoidia bacterium]